MIRKPARPIFPPVPQVVREWNQRARGIQREQRRIMSDVAATTDLLTYLTMDIDAFDMPTVGPVPEEVKQAHRTYVNAYNAEVRRYNAEVEAYNREIQAVKNSREVQAVRQAACPRCFSTHPGEC